ncbi:MAG TPA: hypothetical protein PK668_18445 [Myxococcota bacterium]|nr:hypothetical protein [Myxococcota bacterium]HRY95945.1 hypothetical protein [Myxococcota bacterium]
MGNERRTGDGAKGRVIGLLVAMAVGSVVSCSKSSSHAEDRPWSPEPDSKAIEVLLESWQRQHPDGLMPLPAEQILADELRAGRSIAEAGNKVASALSLPASQARELVDLVLGREWISRPDFDPARRSELVAGLRRRFVDLLRASTYHEAVVAEVLAAVSRLWGCTPEILEEIAARAPEPLQLGMRLTKNARCPILLGQLHTLAPENRAILWALASDSLMVSPWRRLALLEDLSKRLKGTITKDDPLFVPTVAVQRAFIDLLLDAGMTSRAIEVHAALSKELQAALLVAEPKTLEPTVDGFAFTIRLSGSLLPCPGEKCSSILLDLAAAHESLGQRARAKELFQQTHVSLVPRAPITWTILDRLLSDPNDDPFVWAKSALGCSPHATDLPSRLWAGLAFRAFTGDGFQQTRWRIGRNWERRWIVDPTRGHRAENPATFRDFGEDFERRTELYHQHFLGAARGLIEPGAPPPSLTVHRPAERTRGMFGEKSMPDEQRTLRDPKGGRRIVPVLPPGVAPLPPDQRLMRFEAAGDQAVAITATGYKELDGDSRGKRVHLSKDGGKSWTESLYLHLGSGSWSFILPDSKRPLLSGDTLEPEVQELFHTNTYLEIPLADLRMDTDSDGLGDLLEKRLLLDPANPDSDGDGLLDGEDPMPNVALAHDGGPDAGWRLEVLRAIFMGRNCNHMMWDKAPEGPLNEVRTRIQAYGYDKNRPAVLLIGEGKDYQSFLPDRRVLVFTEAEFARHCEALGEDSSSPSLQPVSFPVVVFNRDRSQGFISWRWGAGLGMRGGTYEFTRTEGGWTVKSICSWIS